MYDNEEKVTTYIRHQFKLPRFEWQELRSIYRQWVHIEDDPLYKSFMQQGQHMTIDLLTNMQKTLKSHVEKQCKEANNVRSDVWDLRKQQGEEITQRILKALKDSNWSRQMDYKRFSEIVTRLVDQMANAEIKVQNLREDCNNEKL